MMVPGLLLSGRVSLASEAFLPLQVFSDRPKKGQWNHLSGFLKLAVQMSKLKIGILPDLSLGPFCSSSAPYLLKRVAFLR